MIITAVPTLFILTTAFFGSQRHEMKSMNTITNKGVHVHLDNEEGTLLLAGLLDNTMIFLYDSFGEIKGKYKFVSPSIVLILSARGSYVLVMSHPNCQPEVRRIIY